MRGGQTAPPGVARKPRRSREAMAEPEAPRPPLPGPRRSPGPTAPRAPPLPGLPGPAAPRGPAGSSCVQKELKKPGLLVGGAV